MPDSRFPLSALCFGEDHITAGVNWEAQDRTLGTCGEMAAVMNLVSTGGPFVLNELLMMGGNEREANLPKIYSSCAACRQFMSELDQDGKAVVESVSVNGMVSGRNKVEAMLPDAFVFRNYIDASTRQSSSMPSITKAPLVLRGVGSMDNGGEDWIHSELKQCAYRSFVPDESYLQGAILITKKNTAYCGSLFQTANYRSSKNALVAALTMMISYDGLQAIQEVHFLHIENRPFFKQEKIIFPFEVMSFLVALGVQNIVMHTTSGISERMIVNDLGNLFGNARLDITNIQSYVVPEIYRGSI